MKIIIAGDGKVDLALTRLLSQEGHDLVTIDTNREVLERSAQLYDVMAVVGNCATMATLREANVEQADLLIAATSADEINLLCCLTARKLNPSLHTIARVRSPEYLEQLYLMREDFGLSMLINPEREAAKEIFRLLKIPGFLKRETFAKGRVEIVELRVLENSLLENVSLSRLPEVLSGCRVLVCAVIRGGKVIIPSGDTILRRGDHIYVTAPVAVLSELVKRLGIPQKKIRHAMLIGGGRVSYYLAQSLLGAGVSVKIIEQKPERCQQLASMLPRAYIIEGDGSSQSVLETEGIAETDALLEAFIRADGGRVDYIHGQKELVRCAAQEGCAGVVLPPIEKDDFFSFLKEGAALPKKSFSVGGSKEKRYYLEGREISYD